MHLIETVISASEESESLSELEIMGAIDPIAFSNCRVNCWRTLGEQQQHCQPDNWTFNKHSSPKFLFKQELQNKILHDLQLTKSLFPPHHPQ